MLINDRVITNFWKHITKTESCWICNLYVHGKWHPNVRITENGVRKFYSASRGSWVIHNGVIHDGLFVCHKCDNPKCVNPDHLFLGTQKDNMIDMYSKGRDKNPFRIPELQKEYSARAKLPEDLLKQKNSLKEIYHQQGTINSQYGTFWITNGAKNKKWKDELGVLPEGYLRGSIS